RRAGPAGGFCRPERRGLLSDGAERRPHHPDASRHARRIPDADRGRRRNRHCLRSRLSPVLASGGPMSLTFPAPEEIARLTARMLLEIKGVDFNAAQPSTYASGLKGPTYVDCRRIISFPRVRSTLMDFMAATVM